MVGGVAVVKLENRITSILAGKLSAVMRLDSVFDSLRGDDLCFCRFIRVKMAQHCHESSTGLTPFSPVPLPLTAGGTYPFNYSMRIFVRNVYYSNNPING